MSVWQTDLHEMLTALGAKDAPLFARLGHLTPSAFYREWRKVYPEDFTGSPPLAAAASIVPLDNRETRKP